MTIKYIEQLAGFLDISIESREQQAWVYYEAGCTWSVAVGQLNALSCR